MRQFLYGLAFVLLVFAGATAIAEIFHMLASGVYRPVSLGSIWYSLHGNSLVGFQALIEKNISPLVWSPVQLILTMPTWIVLGVPGLILLLTCRPRHRGLGSGLG
ncbi:MAG: hypothetical protein KDF64_03215 [Geminicoccaceae bacterium]|nr:hypothetical protein [Geminicoccaceae bacterium]